MNAEEIYEEGMEMMQEHPREVFGKLKRAADMGHAEAQFEVAMLYKEGLCCAMDKNKSIEYVWKAAWNQNREAENYLVNYYEHERPDEQKLGEALTLLANRGDAFGAFEMALLCIRSRKYYDRREEAEKFLKKARENGIGEYISEKEIARRISDAEAEVLKHDGILENDTSRKIGKKHGAAGSIVYLLFSIGIIGSTLYLMAFHVMRTTTKLVLLPQLTCLILTCIFVLSVQGKFAKGLEEMEEPLTTDAVLELIARLWLRIVLCAVPTALFFALVGYGVI